MPSESPYMTRCLQAIVILTIFLTISKILTVEFCMTFILTFRMGQGQIRKEANEKPMHDLLFYGNSNFYPIYYHFQDIHCQNVQDLDLDL